MIEPSKIVQAINKVKEGGNGAITIAPYEAPKDIHSNEYCLFLKPEICRSTRLDRCIEAITSRLAEFGQSPSSCRVLGSKYLIQNQIMEAHYGVIDTVSHRGAAVISDEARATLKKAFEAPILETADMLGGHQFLERYSTFSADALAILYDNMSNVKLAGGTHCVMLKVRGKPTILFNGFHPEQLENYTRQDSAIVVFSISTAFDWKKLRVDMTGATNPTRAAQGSIRRWLLENREELGLSEVSSGRNGIHVSAGPLEGMVELLRFMSDPSAPLNLGEMGFGQLLLQSGFNLQMIERLASNPTLKSGATSAPAFDLTEERNAEAAMKVLIDSAVV